MPFGQLVRMTQEQGFKQSQVWLKTWYKPREDAHTHPLSHLKTTANLEPCHKVPKRKRRCLVEDPSKVGSSEEDKENITSQEDAESTEVTVTQFSLNL